MNGDPLTSRDYKRSRRHGTGFDFRRVRGYAIGLGAGLCVAGLIYVADHRPAEPAPETPLPAPRKSAADDATRAANDSGIGSAGDSASAERKYDFYQMLPKFEVVVPEKERGSRVAPAAKIDRPGIYFLQIGSYRDETVADRVHAQLAKLGIDTQVQRVAVDADVWHRVRIGPIRDLAQLNHLRQQLQASDFDSLVIRVDD